MSRKKTPQQRANTGSKSGKAKNKHKTVAQELILSDNNDISKVPQEKQLFYDMLVESCEKTDILSQKTDAMQLEMIVTYWFKWRGAEDMLDAEGLIIYEANGNTGEMTRKPHPAHKISNDAFNRLMKLLNETGLTRNALARIAEKASQIKQNQFSSEEQTQHKQGTMQDWAKKANPEK